MTIVLRIILIYFASNCVVLADLETQTPGKSLQQESAEALSVISDQASSLDTDSGNRDDSPATHENSQKNSSIAPSLQDSFSSNQSTMTGIGAKRTTVAGAGSGVGLGSGVSTANPLTVVGGLLFVLLLIFVLAWLIRRMGGLPMMGGHSMKVVSALSVGTREKVVLIELGEQQLLLGVAPGRVTHLKSFEHKVIESAPVNSDFSSAMKKMLHKNKLQESDNTAGGL